MDPKCVRVPRAAKERFLAEGDLDSEHVRRFRLAMSSREHDNGTGGALKISSLLFL